VNKASVSQVGAEEAAQNAATIVAQAEEVVHAAQAELNESRSELIRAQTVNSAAIKAAAHQEALLTNATAAVAAASALIQDHQDSLRTLKAAAAEAEAVATNAFAVFSTARHALMQATQNAMGIYLANLRQKCEATESQFEAYLKKRELISLVRIAEVHRLKVTLAAQALHDLAVSNSTRMQLALSAESDALWHTERLHHNRKTNLDQIRRKLELRRDEVKIAISRWTRAQEQLHKAQRRLSNISDILKQFDQAAASASALHIEAVKRTHDMRSIHTQRMKALTQAMNKTGTCIVAADVAEERAEQVALAVAAAKAWLAKFVVSLELEAKHAAVEMAKTELSYRQKIKHKAAQREQRMKKLLQTHDRHLKLLNHQVGLEAKEKARLKAKEEFDLAEKAVIDAQAKYDTLTKDDHKTDENIGKTHREVQNLLDEYHAAQEGYQKQDPEDRKRSFSTMLEGSGPDANGVDIR